MIVSEAFRGKRFAVLGLARSGLATVRALVASGAEVVAWDEREEARASLSLSPSGERLGEGATPQTPSQTDSPLSQPSPLKGRGLLSFADPLTIDLTGFDGVVVSPGVPLNRHPIKAKADAAGVPIIGDIELFAQARASLPPHKVVGITGTNGKSTTTALIHHILNAHGIPAMMGGNIGLPILGQVPLPARGIYVLELSSYQIDLTYSLACDVAVLLNVTPDHLDRYTGFDDYRASKIRLLELQDWDSVAIVASEENGVGDAVRALNEGAELTQWFGGDFASDFAEQQKAWPSLQGPHNAQNVWAARVTCLALGLSLDQIDAGLKTYPGLPHRMERIRNLDGVLWVNDSKATNADSVAPALAAYPVVHWILGGVAKTKELDACAPNFGHVKAAYTIGEAGPMFAELLAAHMPVEECGVLDEAVHRAYGKARKGETVLFSPACASFDQFRDFEARGDAFRALVEAL